MNYPLIFHASEQLPKHLPVVKVEQSTDYNIGGQTRSDVIKCLHESAMCAFGKPFADFLQTVFHQLQTFC